MFANCFDKNSRPNKWEEMKRETCRAEVCILTKNKRFLSRIKNFKKNIKKHMVTRMKQCNNV